MKVGELETMSYLLKLFHLVQNPFIWHLQISNLTVLMDGK